MATESTSARPPEGRRPQTRPSGKTPVRQSLKVFAAVGVLASVLIAVALNVLVARFYKRWDWTRGGLYTLSMATRETLVSLGEPLDVIVFLSASDALMVSVRHMLTAYGAETSQIRPRYVDPDRDPAEFQALQQKYGIVKGKTEDGRVVTDASIVIARGERHWFVTTDDMIGYDENDGRARPKLEQALTEGIRNVLERERAKICFTTGHQEISLDDGGPMGLGELRHRLGKNNYEVESVDLSALGKGPALGGCRVVVVSGPEAPVSEKAVARLIEYLKASGNLLVLANPVLDDDNRIRSTGLEPVTRAGGIEFQGDFIIERDEAARLPQGLGETFFALPKEHDVTKGLFRGDKPAFKVLVSSAQSLKPSGKEQPGSLLSSSDQAFSVRDIRPFTEEGKTVEKGAGDASGPFQIAMAAELPKPAGSKEKHGPRLVVIGTANLVWSQVWRDPALNGNRLFIESALSWLATRPAIVSVPEKPSHDIGLSLTEESLSEVWRYVLLYMPGSAALLAIVVMYRRRVTEKRSRRRDPDESGSGESEAEQSDEEKAEPAPESSADEQPESEQSEPASARKPGRDAGERD